MKANNLIDMTSYFLAQQKRTVNAEPSVTAKIFHILARVLETSATVVTALCICICTLLFFTML